jgi:hypothetical protein
MVKSRWAIVGGMMFCAVLCTKSASAQVRVLPGDIRDTRSTTSFFNKLEVEMKLIGDLVAEAKGVRVAVTKAVDETGKNLLPEKAREEEFKEIGSSNRENFKIDVELKNPARRAMAVQEIAGTIELFIPGRDPAATISIQNLAGAIGRRFDHPGLKAIGVELTIWNKAQYEARRQEEEAKMKQAFEERKKKAAAAGESIEDLGDALAEGLMKAFGGLFSAFSQMGDNGIAFNLKDPKWLLIGIEFEDAAGKTIDYQGRSSMGGEDRTLIYDFSEPLPEGARAKLFLLTPKALVKSPFRLTNVPLP